MTTNGQMLARDARLAECGPISWVRVAQMGTVTAVLAIAVNVVIYFIASGLGAMPDSVTPMGDSPMTAGMVAAASAIGVTGATTMFGVLVQRHLRAFRIGATVLLILSLTSPISIPDAPTSMILSLAAMHVVTWALCVMLLPKLVLRDADA